MVPYASFPYADHVLRQLKVDPNKKAEPLDDQIDVLIEGAQKLKEIMQDLERMDEIKGFVVYSPEVKKPQKEKAVTEEGEVEQP